MLNLSWKSVKQSCKKLAASASPVKFVKDDSGQYAILFGFLFPVMLLAGGIAVDTAEVYRAKVNFQIAVDAAALAAAKNMAATSDPVIAEKEGKAMFEINMANLNPKDGRANISFDFGDDNNCLTDGVVATATLQHPVFFDAWHKLRDHSGIENHALLNGHAKVACSTPRLEIALVLDNSGSMGSNNKIGTLRSASTNLVQTLHNAFGEPANQERIRFSVVPFAATVNIGKDNKTADWMDQLGLSPAHHEHFNWDDDPGVAKVGASYRDITTNQVMTRFAAYDNMQGEEWQGCVEKRPYPHHTLDTEPTDSAPATLFLPSFAPDTPDNWSGQKVHEPSLGAGKQICKRWQKRYRNNGSERATRHCRKWTDNYEGFTHPQDGSYTPTRNDKIEYRRGEYIGAIPPGQASVVWQETNEVISEKYYYNNYLPDNHNFPLTAGHPLYSAYVNSGEDGQWKRQKWGWKYRAGPNPTDMDNTNFVDNEDIPRVVGLRGGPNLMCTTEEMRDLTFNKDNVVETLSNMRAEGATDVGFGLSWGWRTLSPQEPLTNGREYNAQDNTKIIILMTDGNNTYYPIDYFSSSKSKINKSLYGAYGMAKNREIFKTKANPDGVENADHDFNTYRTKMDEQMLETCQNAKAEGVQIYTIVFDVPEGATIGPTMQACATTTPAGENLSYRADDNAELIATFQAISERLANLSIVE